MSKVLLFIGGHIGPGRTGTGTQPVGEATCTPGGFPCGLGFLSWLGYGGLVFCIGLPSSLSQHCIQVLGYLGAWFLRLILIDIGLDFSCCCPILTLGIFYGGLLKLSSTKWITAYAVWCLVIWQTSVSLALGRSNLSTFH